MGRDIHVELVDWQKAIAIRASETAKAEAAAFNWSVPVAIDSLILLVSQIVFGLPITGIATTLAAGRKHIQDVSRARNPAGIDRILQGTSTLSASTKSPRT
jgi:hypothetical protein